MVPPAAEPGWFQRLGMTAGPSTPEVTWRGVRGHPELFQQDDGGATGEGVRGREMKLMLLRLDWNLALLLTSSVTPDTYPSLFSGPTEKWGGAHNTACRALKD